MAQRGWGVELRHPAGSIERTPGQSATTDRSSVGGDGGAAERCKRVLYQPRVEWRSLAERKPCSPGFAWSKEAFSLMSLTFQFPLFLDFGWLGSPSLNRQRSKSRSIQTRLYGKAASVLVPAIEFGSLISSHPLQKASGSC